MQTFREWLREKELNENKGRSGAHIEISGDNIEDMYDDLNKNKQLMKIIEKLEKTKYGIGVWLWSTDHQNFNASLRKFKKFASNYNGDAV